MGIQVSVTTKGVPPLAFIRGASKIVMSLAEDKLYKYALDARGEMRQIIETAKKTKNSENTLENAIDIDSIISEDMIVYGIGRVQFLKEKAPYYEILDVGGIFQPKTDHLVPLGRFSDGGAPEAGMTNSLWQVGAGNYTFFDKKSNLHKINGIDYVGQTSRDLQSKLQLELPAWIGAQITQLKSQNKNYVAAWGKSVRFDAHKDGMRT